MKRIGLFIGFLALLIVVLPNSTAQDEKKKDDAKVEKKDDAKKDEPKKDAKDEKKDDEKKDDKKKEEPKKVSKEKLNYAYSLRTKIISVSEDSGSEMTIEVQEADPKKVYEVGMWAQQRQAQLRQELFNAQQQKGQGYQQAMFNYNINVAKFQAEKASKSVTSPKNVEVKASEHAKVRLNFLRDEFDDNGFKKKWTKKEVEARRDKTGLPGFPAEFSDLKTGQIIDIYMAKAAPKAKDTPAAKKKNADDDDVPVAKMPRQEYVMIVIVSDPVVK